jgi:hypothetical protein
MRELCDSGLRALSPTRGHCADIGESQFGRVIASPDATRFATGFDNPPGVQNPSPASRASIVRATHRDNAPFELEHLRTTEKEPNACSVRKRQSR